MAGDGITQTIRMMLDQQALKQLEKDAANGSKRAAQAVANELSNSSAEGRAVEKFVGKLREQFEANLVKIRKQLAQGLVDLPEATKQAQELAATFNAELEKGLKKAAKGVDKSTQAKILGAARVDADNMAVEIHRDWAKELSAGIKDGVDKGVAGARGRLSGLFNLVSVPDREQLTQKQGESLLSRAKGDVSVYNNLVQRSILLTQLDGTELTKLGKIYTWFGGNVNTASTQLKSMTTKLSDLGVGQSRINAALPVTGKGFAAVGQGAMALVRQLGLVYTGYQALNFIKSSVKDFIDLQQAWTKLSVTVADYGTRLSDIKPQVDALLDSTAKLGITQAESLEVLARLTQITGDHNKAIRALPTVLNIAASGYMTLEQATRQVGRAMLGDITQIQRYGIFLEKNVDVISQLDKMFGGEAAAKARTFGGQLQVINAEFNRFKVALGQAVATGTESGGGLGKISDLIEIMTKFIKENHQAIGVWANFFKMALLGIATVISLAIAAFVKLTEAIMLSVVVIEGSFRAIPSIGKIAFASLVEAAALAFRQIAEIIDTVFKTHLAQSVDGVIVKMDNLRKSAKKDLADNGTATRTIAREVTGGSSQEVGAEDAPLGSAKQPRARYLQQVSAEISAGRKVVLGDDLEKSEKEMAKLLELREKLTSEAEALKDNDRAALDYNARIADIDKIRDALAAKKLKIEQDAKGEAELTRKINILGNIAQGEDLKNRRMAITELLQLHDQLIIKRDKLNVKSDKYWQTQNHIKEIEDKILEAQNKEDEAWQKKVKKLGNFIDLNIDVEDSTKQLMALYDEEQKKLDSHTLSLDDQAKARSRQIQIEVALRREIDVTSDRVQQLGKDIDDPAKRIAATRELVKIRNELNDKLAKHLIVSTNIAQVENQIKDIDQILAESSSANLNTIEREITVMDRLGKKYETRKLALDQANMIIQQIDKALEKTNLTEAERNRLIAQRKHVQDSIDDKLGEPDLNVVDQFMDVLKHDVPGAFADAAKESARVFSTAFEYILRDSRDLSHALNSIGKGMAASVLKELEQLAEGKVKEHLAWALSETAWGIGDTATGNFAAAGAHFASAGEHVAAAAAWGVVAGATASLDKSANKAYANSTSPFTGANGNRGFSNDFNGKIGPDIYISFDPLDPNNPRVQDLIGLTNQKYQERYGGRIVLRATGAN